MQSPLDTPKMRSPPHSHVKNASRLTMSTLYAENVSPNATYMGAVCDTSSQSSVGDSPEFPSPAHTTPFYVRPPRTLDDDESFEMMTTATKGSRATVLVQEELPPTPVCAEPPKSVKILRHRPHLDINSSFGSHTPLMMALGNDAPNDESLGSTPMLSSPPASVPLLAAGCTVPKQSKPVTTASAVDNMMTPVSQVRPAINDIVPESAFDAKYQRGFESEMLGGAVGPRHFEEEEESWLIDVPDSTPGTPADLQELPAPGDDEVSTPKEAEAQRQAEQQILEKRLQEEKLQEERAASLAAARAAAEEAALQKQNAELEKQRQLKQAQEAEARAAAAAASAIAAAEKEAAEAQKKARESKQSAAALRDAEAKKAKEEAARRAAETLKAKKEASAQTARTPPAETSTLQQAAPAQTDRQYREQQRQQELEELKLRQQKDMQDRRTREQEMREAREKELALKREQERTAAQEKQRQKLEAMERERERLAAEMRERKVAEEAREQERKKRKEEQAEKKLQQEKEKEKQQVAAAVAKQAPPAPAPAVRWQPKPEQSLLDDYSVPPSLAENPVYVRPAPRPEIAQTPISIQVTMDTFSVSVTRTKAAAKAVAEVKPAPIVAKPIENPAATAAAAAGGNSAKTDSKARLKLVYAVFVARGSGALNQEEVQAELATQGHEWSSGETQKTLNMLVVLKLLQKDGADTWKLK